MEEIFVGSEALAHGAFTRGRLRWHYRPIFPNIYIPTAATPSLSLNTLGAWLWTGRQGVIAGRAAAALHGALWVDECAPIELIWRCGRPPPGIVARNERIDTDEIIEIAGIPVTTPVRTALDLARHLSRDPAVSHLDALARATGVSYSDVLPLVDRYPGARGLRRSIVALALMDGGSQSPNQTLLRLALIDGGFPAPRTHIRVNEGCTTATIAMGYEKPMVGVDYDIGASEMLGRMGWMMVPADPTRSMRFIVYQVRTAVRLRGYSPARLHNRS